MVQLTRKMASWILASQFFLIAVLSLNVDSFPSKNGRSQHNPGSSDVKVKAGLQRAKSQGVQPRSTVSWVLARPKQKVFPVQSSNSQSPAGLSVTTLPATLFPPTLPPSNPEGPAVSEVDSPLNVPPPLVDQQLPPVSWMRLSSKNFYPSRKSGPSETQKVVIPWFTEPPKIIASPPKPEESLPVSPSTQEAPISWLGFPPNMISSPPNPEGPADPLEMLPVPPSTQEAPVSRLGYPPKKPFNSQGPAGSLGSPYNSEVHQSGPGEWSTEDLFPFDQVETHDEPETLNSGLPSFTYPDSRFQGGHLHNSASLYEQGNLERETEDNDFVPMYPYAAALNHPFLSMGGMIPQSAYMRPAYPNLFYYFLTGQLPHGTVSHTQTDYEVGGDHTTDFGYDRYRFTSAKSPDNPSQVSTMQL